jgi:type IV pilus assembly protein PilQ
MKNHLSKTIYVFIFLWIFAYTPGGAFAAAESGQGNKDVKVGYLENVLFEKMPGKERVSLVVSQQSSVNVSRNADGSLLVKLDNMFVPESLRRNLGDGELLNVLSVLPQQQTQNGNPWANLTITLKESVPYSVRQEGRTVLIDFNIAGIDARPAVLTLRKQDTSTADLRDVQARPVRREPVKRYTDRIISLDFQDADIKSVLRLMAEYGNMSIISGDDVKGTVTLAMKNVPWDQALESILKVHGLSQQPMGDVITVMTLERKKKDEADKMQAEADQRKAEDERKKREIELLAEKGELRQILIEAKIVEATEDFLRNLGVSWGFGNHRSIGSYGLGLSGGSSTLQSNTGRMVYPPEIPFTSAGTTNPLYLAAVNLPAALASPTLGLVFGGARGFIETQLAALETSELGKVISSPKVVTMDNVKAVIKQGDEVPYVTPASGTSPATVTFKEAVLRLEVKPKITHEGRISMEIKATNDTPDYARGERLQGNPPIRKNEVESKIVVSDGDTVVIGGVSRVQEDNTVRGIPWFYKIPALGWLFKTEGITRQKRQLLIFITPKILSGSGYVETTGDEKP